jgi:SAM-dependent methyltransferase
MYRSLLKLCLRLHSIFFDRLMYHVAPKVFGGNHPKNIFHFRSEFFVNNGKKSDVVLDLACGQGTILKNMAPAIGSGIGMDQNPRQLRLARQNCPGNVEFLEGDIDGKLVADLIAARKVSKVVLSHILEHLPDPVGLMKKLHGIELLICVPSQENWYRQLLKNLGLPFVSDPSHFRE